MNNLTPLGHLADRYDALVLYDEKFLDDWVEEQKYSTGAMVLASTASAFVQFAQSFTDMGRLGNGIFLEGGWKGAGKDFLRAINIAGTAGAALGRVGTFFRVVQESQSGMCTYVAQANALRRTAHRLFITAEDLAKATGADVDSIWRAGAGQLEYEQLLAWMDKAKLPYRILLRASQGEERSLQALEAAIRNTQGVVTFGIRATGRVSKFGKLESTDHLIHRLYAEYSATRGLEIRDPLGPVFRSMRELSSHFRDLSLSRAPVVALNNSTLTTMSHVAQRVTEAAAAARSIGFEVLPMHKIPASDPQTASQVVQIQKSVSASGTPQDFRSYSVAAGDTLSGIAQNVYGSANKWPLLFAANKNLIGVDPNKIRPGQILNVPRAPAVRYSERLKSVRLEPLR